MPKVIAVSVLSEHAHSRATCLSESLGNFNPIMHVTNLIDTIDTIDHICLYSQSASYADEIESNFTGNHPIFIKTIMNGDLKERLDQAFPRDLLKLVDLNDFDGDDTIIYFNPLLFLPDSGVIFRALRYAEREKVILGIRPVINHPCLMFNLRDQSVLDPYSPAHEAITSEDFYFTDFNIVRNSKSNKPILRRQDFPVFYESLRGLVVFKYKWLNEIILPSLSRRIYPIVIENGFLIQSMLDLLKAATYARNSG